MTIKLMPFSNKFAFVFVCIIVLLCADMALGSTLDVSVYYEGKPAANANIYIDDNILLGQTDSNGKLKDLNISPGPHVVVAKWQNSIGIERSGAFSYTAEPDTYAMKRIDLQTSRNLGWIWQLVKNRNN
jgi:hypothetical protein